LRAKDLADARYFERISVTDPAAYDELSARGVTFTDPPTAQAYGIDTSFRDPSGHNI
jgi:hypothetical protein